MNIEATYETAPVKTITICFTRGEALMLNAIIGGTSKQSRINRFNENIPDENRREYSPEAISSLSKGMGELHRII